MKNFPFQKIIDWHIDNSRENLPWRNYDFNKKELGYRVWLSEIILQQTQVSRGSIYFEKIIKAFPTIENLAATSYDGFFEYYKGLGYYSRARNMLKTAIIVSEEFNGTFPEDTTNLLSLPGVGPYTAEAIRAFAYQKSTLSFDTNLLKIFSRYYHGNKFIKLSKSELEDIQQQFKKSGISGREMNNALMDFAQEQDISKSSPNLSGRRGRAIDNPPSSPSGEDTDEDYPLPDCKYYKTKGKLEPVKKKGGKYSFPTKEANIVIVLHKDHKIYFSEDLDNYKPFVLSPLLNKEGVRGWSSREFAKQHFLEKYNLHISVRPPHKKDFQDGKPYLVCYAQIQKGESEFGEFRGVKKSEIEINL